ncbi:MAG: Tetratricopeptide 2 repeat protein [Planctomycetaceae bacterium]|nr:Tetratricopeptide 2 repeat protein [Planctomycetaceae bacterium]
MSPLSNQELIQLVQEKTPEELTEQEVAQLRSRLRESPELREALVEQLHFEAYLNEAFGRFEVSVERIVTTTPDGGRNRISGYWRWTALLFFGLLFGSVATFIALRPQPAPVEKTTGTEIADAKSGKKSPEDAKSDEAHAANNPVAGSQSEKQPGDKPATSKTDVAKIAASGSQTTNPGTVAKTGIPATPVVAPMATPVDPTKVWKKEFEAEKFARGNVQIDNKNMGKEIGVIHADDAKPVFVEHEIQIPQDGKYRLDLRYAAKVQRPLKLIVNGVPVLSGVARSTTKDWKPVAQSWFPVGDLELKAGLNTLRWEADPVAKQPRHGQFPAVDKFSLTSTFAVTVPVNPQEIAQTNTPWQPSPNQEIPVQPAVEASFSAQGDQWGLRRDRLQQWLEPVANMPHQFRESQHGEMPLASFEGLLKLRAPWLPDTVMRISPLDHFGLRLHFWNGTEGVTFQFSDRPAPWWGAYASTRQNGSPRPEKQVLINSADGRFDISLHGPVEFRYQAGTLIFSRGDVRLMTVPFAQPPTEVYFDGKCTFSGFAMYRGTPLADEMQEPRPFVLVAERPAQVKNLPKIGMGGILSSLPDGGLELTSEKAKEPSQVTVPLESAALCEIILQIEGATPGTGVFVGSGGGLPINRLGFCRETHSKRTCLAWLRPAEQHVEMAYDLQNQIVPFTGDKQWVRLVLGNGVLKCWVSADGVHWGRALDPLRYIRGGTVEFGLYSLPGEERHSITLRRIEVRELNGLTAIVPDDLLDRVPSLPGDLEPEAWLESVLSSRPPNIDSMQWRQACALRTLALGSAGELGKTLLSALIADVIVRPVSPADRVRFLNDAALISDTWDHADGMSFSDAFERLGQQLILEGHPQPCRFSGTALLRCPLWTTAPIRVPAESLARYELVQSLYKEDWDEVGRICRWLRFWNKASHPGYQSFHGRDSLRSFVELAEAGVQRFGNEAKPAPRPSVPGVETASWRHPLIEQLSKEGYNVLAEFEAALAGDSFKDACQIVAAASASGSLGLLPDARDRRLLVSLPRAVSQAMREYPQLQKTMITQFGPIGRIRVRQAIAEGNTAGIQAATLQFTGTEAAAEAHAWLGDQAMAAGNFVQASGQYQQALPTATHLLRQELQAKLRLVSALSARPKLVGKPPTVAVLIGKQKLEPAQFEQLVNDVRASRVKDLGSDNSINSSESAASIVVPAPSGLEFGRRFPFEGSGGRQAGNNHYVGTDTTGREFTVRAAGNWLLASNRFQVTAFDLTTGERKWNTGMKDDEGDAHNFPLLGMPPVVHARKVFVRRLTRNGPELACLELATGKLLWNKRAGNHVISDPLVIEDDLFAFIVEEPQIGLLQVSLVNFEPETGEVISQSLVMQLRDVWGTKVPCQAVASGDKILATIGGSVVCCDLLGRLRWLRRQTWLPPADQYGFFRQFRQTPVVVDNRVYVTQPGVLAVECLDLENGRQIWQQAWPELRRIVGLVNNSVIIEAGSGLHALRADNGERIWTSIESGVLEAQICGNPGGILVARAQRLRNEQRRLSLAWLDSATGLEIGRTSFPELQDKEPQAATLVPDQGKIWLAWGKNPRDFRRELIELVPKGLSQPGRGADSPLARWTTHVPGETQEMVAEFLPGWTLLTKQTLQQAGHQPEFQGLKDLIQTQTVKNRPVIFAREVHVDKAKPHRLRLQVGVQQGQPWQLAVRVNDQVVLTSKLSDETPNKLGTFDVDLAAFAGQTVWLQVAQDVAGNGTSTAFWKQMDLVD